MRVMWVRVWVVVLSVFIGGDNSVWCKKSQRVWLDDSDSGATGGAYRDVVVAIHPSFAPANCSKFFDNLKEALGTFSQQLWKATHGHVHLGDVDVVVPPTLALECSLTPIARATWQKWTTADVLVTPGGPPPEWAWGPEGSIGVGVSQPEGCGRPGEHISLDADVLMELDKHEMDTLGRSLVGSWARYRWGVFEERGYPSNPRYPAVHTMDDVPTPTTCTTTPTSGHWEPKKGSGLCNDTEELQDCKWIPDKLSHVNTSLMYRADLPEMWGFCDSNNHDPDAPTPHNLLCGTVSVWDVMNKHPDFTTKPHSQKSKIKPNPTTDSIIKTTPTKVPLDNVTDVKAESDNRSEVNVTVIEDVSIESNSSFTNSDNESLSLEIVNTTDTLFLDDVRNHLSEKETSLPEGSNSSVPSSEPPVYQTPKPRRKRSDPLQSENSSIPRRPSLVTAHIASSSSSSPLESGHNSALRHKETLEDILSFPSFRFKYVEERVQERKDHSPKIIPPPKAPELRFLSLAPKAVVLALDLSDHAVNQVNMDDLRGGILRWLWGLGADVKVGVVAAYNNASYPLTLGPLLPAPTTAAEMEDELTLLPSADEVEDGVYGGKYCLDCVLTEAAKMLEGGGVETGSGVLLLAACSPDVPASAINLVKEANLFIHTLALCPNANPVFDQLAQSGGLWVLPGLSVKSSDPERENENEHRAALSLTSASRAALGMPGSPTLVRVGSSVVQVTQRGVENAGPYSTVTSKFSLPPAEEQLLIVITTQYQAKVIEVTDISGREIDVIRDTNQRFWAILDKQAGDLAYTLKFLTSSIIFPFSVVVDVYERKQNKAGVEIELHTNNDNHVPLEPNSHPLVVWAKVMRDGQPVVGAKVMLTVSHLSQDGSTDMTLQLLDNGNAEPDVRGHDGVYTRYVTWLPGEGRYALSASASDNQGAASVLAPRRRDGRVVPVSAGQFAVTSAVVSVTVLRVTSDDVTPPSRITDLTVISVHDTTVNLTWSAPGGDLDQGSAWRYELKMYTERSALSEEKFNTSTISVYCITDDLRAPTRTPSTYGTPQHCLTELPFTNLRWYFAIRAVDSANNTGKISNVVSAFVPDPPTAPPPTISEPPANIQTVIMSTVSSPNPKDSQATGNGTSLNQAKSASPDWRVWVAIGVGIGGIILAVLVVVICICCCKRNQDNEEKDPDRPIYKIYVNNAYIQEEDGEIKVVSNGKLVDDKEPSQVQEWVNSLSKFGSNDFGGENGDAPATATEAPLVECKPRASMKYSSPVRFGVLTNGSIMRETCASSSSTSSSKPSDDPASEDFKYRDLSETTSNSTTDGGASASSTEVPPPPAIVDNASSAATITISNAGSTMPPPPPPPSQFHQQPLGIPGPTIVSIHQGRTINPANGYSSDEEGGFRPRTVPGPGPRRYLPTHFSSFRYLPPPPEYRSAAAGIPTATGSIDYPHHTISRATATLPHGTVRSVKKRRHISFV